VAKKTGNGAILEQKKLKKFRDNRGRILALNGTKADGYRMWVWYWEPPAATLIEYRTRPSRGRSFLGSRISGGRIRRVRPKSNTIFAGKEVRWGQKPDKRQEADEHA